MDMTNLRPKIHNFCEFLKLLLFVGFWKRNPKAGEVSVALNLIEKCKVAISLMMWSWSITWNCLRGSTEVDYFNTFHTRKKKKLFHLISRPRSNPTIKLAWKMSSHEKGKRFFEYGTEMPSGCFVFTELEEATKITFTRIIGSGSI